MKEFRNQNTVGGATEKLLDEVPGRVPHLKNVSGA